MVLLDSGPRILTVDIETQRAIVETFSLWSNFTHIDRVIKPSRILCFAAQWRGDERVLFHMAWDDADADAYDRMINAAWKLLDEADVVVTYNGDRFDLQWFNAEFERLRLGPPSPYKSLDLVKVTKKQFKQGLLSMKLDWSARIFWGIVRLLMGALIFGTIFVMGFVLSGVLRRRLCVSIASMTRF
ncbi:ribonuclease H-like domain-containing protein [Mycobacteroides chelonae]|nr:ribonuclease H-like domain-containing protein [Mycobacteroides chelonae]